MTDHDTPRQDEPPTSDSAEGRGKAAQLARLEALADKIPPEREAELEAEYSARARSNREAAKRMSAGDQRPKKQRSPSGKATPRGAGGARPARRAAGTDAEGEDDPGTQEAGAKELAGLAQAVWAAAHDDEECPPDRIPTPHDMAAWWPWPEDLVEVLAAWLTKRAGPDPLTFEAVVPELQTGSDEPLTHVDVAALRKRLPDADLDRLHLVTRYGPLPLRAAMKAAGRIDMTRLSVTDMGLLVTTLALLADLSSLDHPLAPLVDAWQQGPREVNHETRADRRIMPALRVIGPPPERERGILFGGLVEDRPRSAELSLFPELEPAQHRVPLLEIMDHAGLPIRSEGRGAPIDARLIVRCGFLMIRPENRHLHTVRIAVTVREMLDGLWPRHINADGTRGRAARYRIAENWPKLHAALLRARNYTVPDATGGRWFPMALRRLPLNAAANDIPALDDLVVIDLAPVPGAVSGASVDLPWLDHMGVTSGPKWRAYIAGRSLVWLPGTTRRPVPGSDGKRYGWSRNLDDYPVLTMADLRRHSFGARDAKNRTRAAILAPWQDLPDIILVEATDPRTGIRGYRLLPTEAKGAFNSSSDMT